MKIRTIIYTLCIAGSIALCGYGLITLHESGEIPLIDYSQRTEAVPERHIQPEPTAPKSVKQDETPMQFTPPEFADTLAFVHKDYVPSDKNAPTYDAKITQDDKNRITSWSILLDSQHPVEKASKPTDTTKPTDYYAPFVGTPQIPCVSSTWNDGMMPLVDAITNAIKTSDRPLAVRVSLEYTSTDDQIPEYMSVEVFTTETTDVAYKVTFHCADYTDPINYKTGGRY